MLCVSLQYFPVASSTICHLMVSIDRYDTVKRPRVLHLRKKQVIPILVALFAWTSAGILSTPFLFVHPHTQMPNSISTTVNRTTTTHMLSTLYGPQGAHPPIPPPAAAIEPLNVLFRRPIPGTAAGPLPPHWANGTRRTHDALIRNKMCASPAFDSAPGWYAYFIVAHTLLVFILPGLGILLNHVRVRKKLCALSLTARAAHGELPLPMPLLRRPTHVIIVTGMANNNLTRATTSSQRRDRSRGAGGSGGGDQNRRAPGHVKRKPQSKRLGPHDKRRRQQPQDDDPNEPPLDQRPMIVSSKQHSNNLRATASNASNVQQMGNPELPLPQTSTLIYRRRLANILITAAILFVLCWAPYTVAVFYYEVGTAAAASGRRSKIATDLGLLLGEEDFLESSYSTRRVHCN